MGTDGDFETFLREHTPSLLRLAHQLSHDPVAAEDLVQDVMLAVYRRWERVRHVAAPSAYLRRALVNRHLNSVRRQPALLAWREDVDVVEPAAPVDDLVERDAVWRALGRLSARQRAVLVLRHYERCEDTEIAAVLGCRRASVRSLAARGLAALREELEHTDATVMEER